MCYDLTNPLIISLQNLNPELFRATIITPAHAYSVDGFSLQDIIFHIPFIAPNYNTWLTMKIRLGLRLCTLKQEIPLSLLTRINLKTGFY